MRTPSALTRLFPCIVQKCTLSLQASVRFGEYVAQVHKGKDRLVGAQRAYA